MQLLRSIKYSVYVFVGLILRPTTKWWKHIAGQTSDDRPFLLLWMMILYPREERRWFVVEKKRKRRAKIAVGSSISSLVISAMRRVTHFLMLGKHVRTRLWQFNLDSNSKSFRLAMRVNVSSFRTPLISTDKLDLMQNLNRVAYLFLLDRWFHRCWGLKPRGVQGVETLYYT